MDIQKTHWTAFNKIQTKFFNNPNISGFDIGPKIVAGKDTNQVSIRIHVKDKIGRKQIKKNDLFPTSIDSLPIDVIQGNYVNFWRQPGHFDFDIKRTEEFSIIQPGISIGREFGETGTLGLIVEDAQSGLIGLLTAGHVMQRDQNDNNYDVIQPGSDDRKSLDDRRIGKFLRVNKEVDAAFISLNQGVNFNLEQYESNKIVNGQPEEDFYYSGQVVGTQVYKSGRTTGVTTGIVTGIGSYGHLTYGLYITPVKPINENREISYVGDSGAIRYDANGLAIGMEIQGEKDPSPFNEAAIASAYPWVSKFLGLRFVSQQM